MLFPPSWYGDPPDPPDVSDAGWTELVDELTDEPDQAPEDPPEPEWGFDDPEDV